MHPRPHIAELRKKRIDRERKINITKMCRKCKLTKPTTDFNIAYSTADGYDAYCKKCKHDYYINRKRKLAAEKAASLDPVSVIPSITTYPNEFLRQLEYLSPTDQQELLISILYEVKNANPESIPIDIAHNALIIGILLYPKLISEDYKKMFKKAYLDATHSKYSTPLASVAPKIPELRETKARELLKTLLSFYTTATERLASGQTAYEIILTNPQP